MVLARISSVRRGAWAILALATCLGAAEVAMAQPAVRGPASGNPLFTNRQGRQVFQQMPPAPRLYPVNNGSLQHPNPQFSNYYGIQIPNYAIAAGSLGYGLSLNGVQADPDLLPIIPGPMGMNPNPNPNPNPFPNPNPNPFPIPGPRPRYNPAMVNAYRQQAAYSNMAMMAAWQQAAAMNSGYGYSPYGQYGTSTGGYGSASPGFSGGFGFPGTNQYNSPTMYGYR